MKSKNIKPDLLNSIKQFEYSVKNNIFTSDNLLKNNIKIVSYSFSFYLNLLAIIVIIFTLIILFYKYSNKDRKKKQILNFLHEVKEYSDYNS